MLNTHITKMTISGTAAVASPTPVSEPGRIVYAGASDVDHDDRRVRIESVEVSHGPYVDFRRGPGPFDVRDGGGVSQGGVTAVIDYSSWKIIMWVPATKKYFVGDIPKPSFGDQEAGGESDGRPDPNGRSARDVRRIQRRQDVFDRADRTFDRERPPDVAIRFRLRTRHGRGDTFTMHGQMQLADDLDELPVVFAMSVKGTKMAESSMRYDLTSLVRQVPPESDFHPPAGFKRAKNPSAAFSK